MATPTTNNGSPSKSRTRSAAAKAAAAPAGAAAALQEERAIPTASAVATTGATATATSTGTARLSINRQRIPETVDFLSEAGGKISDQMQPFRLSAVSKVFLGLDEIRTSLKDITQALTGPALPPQIFGQLNEPDGNPARQVQVTFDPTPLGGKPPAITILTDDFGGFTLPMPSGSLIPSAGLSFVAHGANGNATVKIPASHIASNGLVGVVNLPSHLDPLPVSILAALKDILPPLPAPTDGAAPATPTQMPSVTIGDADGCQQEYRSGASTDSFPFNVFVRLVEPQLSIVNEIQWIRVIEGQNRFLPLPVYSTGAKSILGGTVASYADRVPVEQPLSVDGFRDQIAGLEANGVFTADETVPMAATLGLGYVMEMQQKWTFAGVGLGDLVYSLPLAPGEQQQVAVFERTDTSAVTESEFFSESEAQQQSALADTSTLATFNSAFEEASRGGSSFQTSSANGGFSIPLFGGGGASSSSGRADSWLQGQREMTQAAAQSTHSSAESQASARRSAARTGMRLATASESESITTRTITNHNHNHALTMQYWQVLRNYDVTTVIDGLTLCCLVPMQIVRFMPPGQPLMLTTGNVLTRPAVLARYSGLIKHMDVLQQAVPRAYQYGLTLLSQFAADPTAEVEPAGGVAEDVISFRLQASIIPGETISVRAVTRRNTRVGPVQLTPPAPLTLPPDKFATREEILAFLSQERANPTGITLNGNLALPQSMNRADVVGFEITRGFSPLSYVLISQAMQTLNALDSEFGDTVGDWIDSAVTALGGGGSTARPTVTLSARELENAVGGPRVEHFTAFIVEFNGNGQVINTPANETYANDTLGNIELPPQPYPVPALQIGPVLRFKDILEIEKAVHHIVRNTTKYSKAVWSSLSSEERAILLDAYTIGVPANGIADPSQMVPLLNCVDNRLLGFFGNSMILPFRIPQTRSANGAGGDVVVAGEVNEVLDLDQGEIESALLAYQKAGFQPPTSTISLPTHGVLGEAVLGCCPSAEKVDLTRFWNWQDSPSDAAPTIAPVSLPTGSPVLTAGMTAPSSLTGVPGLINNVLTAPAPNTSLLQALGQNFASQKDFDTALTGATQLASLITNSQNTASQARSDALKASQALTSQAMNTLGGLVTGKAGGDGQDKKGKNGSGDSSGGGSSGASDAASAVSTLAPILLALL